MRLFAHFAIAAALVLGTATAACQPSAANGGAPPVRLRIVGGLASVNQYTRHEEPFWTRELTRLTGGQATAEIVPYDRAGIRGQEMLRLVQLGAVPYGTLLLGSAAVDEPVLVAPDLAGLNSDLASVRRSTAAFRPYLGATLRERYGVELLALYVYPAQVTFCVKPFAGLGDLAGRRVRVSGATQSDFVLALGGTPVQTTFAEIVPSVRSGNIDCAITGTMSGHTIGLDQVTGHLSPTPINWGIAAFVANSAAWTALPAGLQALLRRELPRLEQEIWAEAGRETEEGIACNSGVGACTSARKGRMALAGDAAADRRRLHAILVNNVLPGWIQRCGAHCAQVWRQTIGPASGIELR